MNFSKIRKLLCLIAAICMLCTLFAGCKKDEDPAPESTEPKLNINLETDDTQETTPSETTQQTQPTETQPVINEKSATVISQLNIRTTPSTEATVSGTLYAGDKVQVERRETVVGVDWAYISAPTSGWICMDFVSMDMPDANNDNTSTPAATAPGNDDNDSTDTPASTSTTKGVVTAEGGLMIRSSASTQGDVKGMYNKGEVITILETKNGWGRTNKGWVKLQYVNTTGTAGGNSQNNTTNNNNNNSNASGNGSTKVQLRGVVTAGELNIRDSASTAGERLGAYTYGDRVHILEKSGNWGRTNKGWISLDYVYQDCTTGTKTTNGTVTATALRIRQDPSTDSDVLGSYEKGDSVKILAQFTFGNTKWGCTNKGWISMEYIDTGDKDDTDTNTSTSTDGLKGFVTGDGLRIRSGAGTDYDVVGSLDEGDNVTITSQKTVGGTTWGKISQGWISMAYVELY